MHKYFYRITERFALLTIVLVVGASTGCTPGPLPPPIPPGLFSASIGCIVVVLFVCGVILLWKNLNSTKTTKTDHLTDALNVINERLTALEEKMKQLRGDRKQ